jgi:hypothetical protein
MVVAPRQLPFPPQQGQFLHLIVNHWHRKRFNTLLCPQGVLGPLKVKLKAIISSFHIELTQLLVTQWQLPCLSAGLLMGVIVNRPPL